MIISIGGLPASGKSAVAGYIATKLGFKHYSAGGIMRKFALDKGITLEALNKLRHEDKSIDKEVDKYQEKLGKKEDNFVMEGRTSFHFIPHSFKVFFTVNMDVAAKRLLKDSLRKGEKQYITVKEARESIKSRTEGDRNLYKKLYGIDYTSKSNYDLIIDTTNLTIEEVGEKVIRALPKK